MATSAGDAATSVALTELSEPQRERALERYKKLRPHLEQNVPLAGVAEEASLPLRTAQHWVSRYRRFGLVGLTRAGRADQGKRRRVSNDLRRLAEGLARVAVADGRRKEFKEAANGVIAGAGDRRRDDDVTRDRDSGPRCLGRDEIVHGL